MDEDSQGRRLDDAHNEVNPGPVIGEASRGKQNEKLLVVVILSCPLKPHMVSLCIPKSYRSPLGGPTRWYDERGEQCTKRKNEIPR